ncbi:GNAT family N-acetyltransferase [Tersicoccus sp. MR15.9]|uniref:GNAT family N-acetyltransferase n=1 Tax=Tersicoccus mangrovi TaxID=3121635 RepID=UPI002FE5BD0C
MSITYRPWAEGDDLELLQILGDASHPALAEGRALLRPASESPFVRTIVAEDDGVPVAAGVVSEASVHPERLWVYIEVARERQREGIGSTLLAMLKQEIGGAPVQRLRGKVALDSPGATFAASAGFGPLQHSQIVVVNRQALPLVPLHEDGSQVIEDLATGSVELTTALWEFYRSVHQWDPPADLSVGRVNQLFLGEAAGAHGAVVLRTNGSITAFAVSYAAAPPDNPALDAPTDEPTDVLLGWDTTAHNPTFALEQLLALLVASYPVALEVDESMGDLADLVAPLVADGRAEVVQRTLVVAD